MAAPVGPVPWVAHVVGPGAPERTDALRKVVGGKLAVHVHTGNGAAPCAGNAGVEPGGHNAAGVVHQHEPGVCGTALHQVFARAVIAIAVGNQHFHAPACGQFLAQGGVAESVDVLALVAARHDHADQVV